MAKGDLLGHIDCPTCGFPEMAVKEDKNGNPYGYCPDCSQQLLTHGGPRADNLRKRMRPIAPIEHADPVVESVDDDDGW